MTVGNLSAPFPYFGGKSRAVVAVWDALGDVKNYVEPFAGSAAMLLGAPEGKRIETINDFDGFVANFWRSIANDPEAVAKYADWPVNEIDLFARHSWLVSQTASMTLRLQADPDFFDAKIAGYWVWGLCNWLGSGWCSGTGPWVKTTEGTFIKRDKQIPHLGDAGQGINKQIPHLGNAGQGINKQIPHLGNAGRDGVHPRTLFIKQWMLALHTRLRDVRIVCGDWQRVCTDSVTVRHGVTGIFLDPPYEKGKMDYGAGGMNLGISASVRDWCISNGNNPKLHIVLCGHSGEHDALLNHGWFTKTWTARKGYAITKEAVENSASETLWCSPHCIQKGDVHEDVLLV